MSMPSARAVFSGALTISFVVAAHGAAAQSKEPYPGLDAYVTNAIETWKIPGLSIAIVRNDSVIYAKGFGVQALSRGRRSTNKRS